MVCIHPKLVCQLSRSVLLYLVSKLYIVKSMSGFLLVISGILAIIVNLPFLSDIFPIKIINGFGPGFISVTLSGGAHFLPSELKIFATVLGQTGTNIITIKGWSIFSIPGYVFFTIFMSTGLLSLFIGFRLMKGSITKNTALFVSLGVSIVTLLLISLLFLSNCSTMTMYGLAPSCLGDRYYYGVKSFAEIGIGLYMLFYSGLISTIASFIILFDKKDVSSIVLEYDQEHQVPV